MYDIYPRAILEMKTISGREHIMTAERLTWEEILKKYPDQWVALSKIDWCRTCDAKIISAEVLYNGASREDVSSKVPDNQGDVFILETSEEGLVRAGFGDSW